MKLIQTKGKHNFWSQLLVSMIAIFALPAVQGLSHAETLNDSYRNEQQAAQQQITQTVALIQQVSLVQQPHSDAAVERAKLPKITPHFTAHAFNPHAPIRAGPAGA
ncbi:secA translation cis-regulator SecM [Pasteurellaceae bacterium LIM206]|nr:secA translation cis-regulator SecM [Pasteurellaceae bacterium LIM206]